VSLSRGVVTASSLIRHYWGKAEKRNGFLKVALYRLQVRPARKDENGGRSDTGETEGFLS